MSPSISISVVCPTFNSEAFVGKALQSILDQTVLPAEVIIIDDGSKDGTVATVESFIPRFEEAGVLAKLLAIGHKGPGFARNTGIDAATGDWISFLDSDDYWEPTKIEEVNKILALNGSLNFVIHWESYQRLNGDWAVLKHGSIYDRMLSLPPQLYKTNAFSTSAVTVRRSLIKLLGGFDPTLPVSQDFELWLKLSPEIRFGVIEKPLGYYVERAASITSKPYPKRLWCYLRILFRHRRKASTPLLVYKTLRAIFSRQWVAYGKSLITGKKSHG